MSHRCPECGAAYTWSRTAILEACRRWAAEAGRAPMGNEWQKATPEYPHRSSVVRVFGSWNAMVREAGFKPRGAGGQSMFTREQALHALLVWVFERGGRVPKEREWRSIGRDRPTSRQIETLFGTWGEFLEAGGYTPRQPFTKQKRREAA